MDSKYSLLDLPVSEGKDMGERRLIYSFDKEEHARLLFNNLGEMQANEGLLTDVVVRSTSKDHEEPFHSMLLAVCSPVIKQSLTGEHFDRTAGIISLKDCTAEVLKAFRDFLYHAEFPQDKGLLHPLQAFAKRYGIDSLQEMCREEYKDQHSVHRDGVISQLYGMFQKSELTTTLLEDGEGDIQFAVHGPLIAAASPVLREILSNDLFSQEGTKYRLKEVSSSILGDLIEYIYTGDITLEEENVVGLLNAACRYEIPALARPCCDWLSLQLDSHNAVGILWLARKSDLKKHTKDLEEVAKAFIIANFTGVYEEVEFDELEYEDLKEIIQHDDLWVESEEDVFYAVAKWVEADEDRRSQYMDVLLQCVRLEHTSLKFLDNLQEHPLIVKSARCLQIVQSAQGKLAQARFYQEATDRGSFDSLQDTLDQTGDVPEFVPRQYDSEEDIKRKLLEEFLQTEPRIPELEEVSPRRGQRKNGNPDLRFKENRRSLGLQKKDGSPDMRFKINREEFGNKTSQEKVTRKTQKGDSDTNVNHLGGRPLKKDGTPDRRFKVNKEAVRQASSQKSSKSSPRESTPYSCPVKKDGTPDMRFKVNKGPQAKVPSSDSVASPVKRDGTPDMRFKVNKSSKAKIPLSGSVASPVKRDGTPDMRFSVNKQSSSNLAASSQRSNPAPRSSYAAGPVKRDGTPDMRYAINKQSASPSPYSSYGGSTLSQLSSCSSPSGPVKRDGTPDMRYAVNKSSSGSLSSGYSSGGSSYGSRSSSTRSVFGSGSSGPLKRDGTPDMRYAANRSSYSTSSASYSSRSSSSGLGYGSSSCGPLKSNGTPDMRFKANRR